MDDRIWQVLLACAREHDWRVPPHGLADLLESVDHDALVARASAHRVSAMLRLGVRGLPGAEHGLISPLEEAHLKHVGRQLVATRDLSALADALAHAGIDFLVVKGAVLRRTIYPRSDLRPFWDIDLVVRQGRLRDALAALRQHGCAVPDERSIARALRLSSGQVALSAPHGTPVDLHWHLLNTKAVRSAFRLDMDELFARTHTVSVDGLTIRTLEPTDALLHLALHAGLAGGNRLMWLKDVDQAIRAAPPDWDELVKRAHHAGMGNLVAVILRRAEATLRTPLPAGVTISLTTSRPWQAFICWCERISPLGPSPAGPSLIRVVTRATRRDARASTVELARRMIADSARRLERLAPATAISRRG